MYEYMTFDKIMGDALAKAKELIPGIDTREGSVIYTALAPAAAELAQMYMFLDIVLAETFADTASRHHLIKRCAERGITPKEATYAAVRGEFTPVTLDLMDKRFNCGSLNFYCAEKLGDGIYRLQCETPGTAGNLSEGALIPVDYIEGLETAQITGLIIPGEGDEETEALRSRYFASLDNQAFGGNIADYKQKVNELDGVGGVKVYPVWNGGGTVRLCIIASDFSLPSAELIDDVQTAVDPEGNQGEGLGIAPIGHVVTVTGVADSVVDIETAVTYQDGWTWEDVETRALEVIDAYFLELAESWADSGNIVVRISQIETRLLDLTGIIDIADTSLNGSAKNLTLGEDEIPVRGDVSG